jgi:hypothetical protein
LLRSVELRMYRNLSIELVTNRARCSQHSRWRYPNQRHG